ncbi:hypothetical protein IGI04_007313 [Brassica rapa subsp. trilocularis]|uniref:Uncharacterized protein n=1 Tax=Brassica rapa subsp. trilocularis TaxID=1813537 RepID=A0ABQ7NJH5_BRACM|nr:hypothetical protein IGI04_007313 [Brassica rapa subsp. trilocularis]
MTRLIQKIVINFNLKIYIRSNDTTSPNTKENQTTIINFSETVLPLNPNCFRNRVHYNSSRQSGFSEILSVIFFSSLQEEESAKEKGRSEAVLLNIVAHLEKLDRKFDSRLTEYDTKFGDFSRGLLDTIGDTVKTTVDESLRVLGVSNSSQPEGQHVMVSEDNQQPESNSGQPDGQNVMVSEDNRQPDSNSGQPASKTPIDKQPEDSQPQKTPDKGQSEKNLADDIAKADAKGMGAKLNSKVVRDKAAGVKKNLDSAFGNADATNADLVSDSPGKEPPFGCGCRGLGKRNNLAADLERNEAELKKKQKQEEAELKRKKKQEEAELKKKQKKEEADQPIRLHKTAVKVDIAQPNLKPYPKIGKYLISQPIRLHKAAIKEIITDDVGIWKEERRKSVGVVHHLTFLHLEAKQKSHLFKWADECLVEEVEDIKAVINGMNRDISELRVNVARLANGLKTESERK